MRLTLAVLAALLTAGSVTQAETRSEAIRILSDNCVSCHGEARMWDLDVRTLDGMLRGGRR